MESLFFALFLFIALVFFIYLYREHEAIKKQDYIFNEINSKLSSLIKVTSNSIDAYQKSFEDLLKANELHIRKIDYKMNERIEEYLKESKQLLGQMRINHADSMEILNKIKPKTRRKKKKVTRKKKKT